MNTMGGTPPGWYPDPMQPGAVRWWDGNAWSDHVHSAAAPANPWPPAAAVPARPATKPRMGLVWAGGAMMVLAMVLFTVTPLAGLSGMGDMFDDLTASESVAPGAAVNVEVAEGHTGTWVVAALLRVDDFGEPMRGELDPFEGRIEVTSPGGSPSVASKDPFATPPMSAEQGFTAGRSAVVVATFDAAEAGTYVVRNRGPETVRVGRDGNEEFDEQFGTFLGGMGGLVWGWVISTLIGALGLVLLLVGLLARKPVEAEPVPGP